MARSSLVSFSAFASCGMLLALLVGGCAGPPPEASTGTFSTSAISAHLSRFQTVSDTVAAARRARYATEHLRWAGVQPVRSGSFFLPHPEAIGTGSEAQAHVVGFLAGRDPNRSSELILVVVDINRPEAAAVLEVVRHMGELARSSVVPEQTLGIALLGNPRTGRVGMADLVRRPVWTSEGTVRVVLPMVDTTGMAARLTLWSDLGISAEGLSVPSAARPDVSRPDAQRLATSYLLAELLYARLRYPELAL